MVTNCSATAVFHTDGFLILLETINYAAVNFDWEEEKAELINNRHALPLGRVFQKALRRSSLLP